MANILASGITAVDKVAEIYRNNAVQGSQAVTGKNAAGNAKDAAKANGAAAETEKISFRECMDKAIQKETSVFPAGEDVVMANPPSYRTAYGVDMTKSRDAMTLDEYKQYICNRVSGLPVSDSMRACSSGVLIFKEEAFENMKADPAYEEEVIGMLREDFAEQLSGYEPNVRYRVIGGSLEESYGAAIPIKSSSWAIGLANSLTSSGLLTNSLLSNSVSGSGLTSSGLLTSSLLSNGLLTGGISGLGLTSSGVLTSGLLANGLLTNGLLASGISPLSLNALGTASGNTGNQQGLSTARGSSFGRTGAVSAYQTASKNRGSQTDIISGRHKWRV